MSLAADLTILQPANEAEAVEAVRAAAATGERLRIRGTGQRGWLTPTEDAAGPATQELQLGGRGQIEWIDAEDRTCRVDASMGLSALDAALANEGLMLPFWDGRPGTVGGAFLGGGPSLLAQAWGMPRDQVLGGRWVLPDGRLIRSGARVVKSVAGYDVTRLFVGSRGQLALCTSLTLRLRPRPTQWAFATLANEDPAARPLAQAAGVWMAARTEAGTQIVFADPLAAPSGTSVKLLDEPALRAQVLNPLAAAASRVQGWLPGLAPDAPLADLAAGLSGVDHQREVRWPPPPSPWLARVRAVVAGDAAPFVGCAR
jgi:FAD/FMN-containing dehydrogenase